jgi:hypothetical protein
VLLGTEPLSVSLFNGGYSLERVTVRLRGEDAEGAMLFERDYTVPQLPRSGRSSIEVPSYDLTQPLHKLQATLVEAEFGPWENGDASGRPGGGR